MSSPKSIAILGAGCAGTAVARELLQHGFEGKIDLFDSREDFSTPQRWCFWDRSSSPYAQWATHHWPSWILQDEHQRVEATATDYQYFHVPASAYFQQEHTKLRKDDRVHFHLGTSVNQVTTSQGSYTVEAQDQTWEADCVLDARHQPQHPTNQREISLYQNFVGVVVETPQPRFNQEAVTLMDFHVPVSPSLKSIGLPFLYILPYSPTKALLELTIFSPKKVPFSELRTELEQLLTTYRPLNTLEEEEGSLWLSPNTRQQSQPVQPGYYLAGASSGCLRPASGYAFLSIQRQAKELAQHLVNGAELPKWSTTLNSLDRLLLELIASQPHELPACFTQLFKHCPGPALIRFMTDCPRAMDYARVIAALPKRPFLRTGWQHYFGKQPEPSAKPSEASPHSHRLTEHYEFPR